MLALVFILAGTYLLCLALTPLARRWARRYGLVDRPDGHRKIHGQPIPVAGGFAILVSVAVALGTALLVPSGVQELLTDEAPYLLGLLLAAVVICGVGAADDLWGLRGRHKLLGQLAGIALVMSFGVLVHRIQFFGWQLELGVLAIPFTAFWLLGAINSLNLIDGMDGFLGTVGVICTLALAGLAVLHNQWVAACTAIALAGALLGFFHYNFPPASIFLGDSGSLLIGLVVGVLAIQSSLKAYATVALAAPLALLIIPIFDTTAAIIRRKLTGRSIYSTDRGHLHHCLQRRGLSHRRILLLVACFCLVTVAGTLASQACNNEFLALLSALIVVGILVATRLFGHAEFLLVKERLAARAVALFSRRSLGEVQQLEVRLQGSAHWNELWLRVTACADLLNLETIRLDVNLPALHEGYHARWDRHHGEGSEASVWRAEIPLFTRDRALGRLEFTGRPDHEPVAVKIGKVAKLVEEVQETIVLIAEAREGAAANGPLAPAGRTEPAAAPSPTYKEPLHGAKPA
jgi:UDP-GlcNAc:undecaprenyl-phosphate GlcNAc-1-phosphate transferase